MTVTERFLKYVTFETTSDESSDSVPSTATQLVLADYLVEELRGAGVTDAMRDEMGYVYGHIPASDGCENCPKIGLVSHMDTSPDVSGANVKPQIIKFDGTNAPMVGDEYIGRELIVTDHTTLLGADDKAGVAEIVALCAEINANKNIRHGGIARDGEGRGQQVRVGCAGSMRRRPLGIRGRHADRHRAGACEAFQLADQARGEERDAPERAEEPHALGRFFRIELHPYKPDAFFGLVRKHLFHDPVSTGAVQPGFPFSRLPRAVFSLLW